MRSTSASERGILFCGEEELGSTITVSSGITVGGSTMGVWVGATKLHASVKSNKIDKERISFVLGIQAYNSANLSMRLPIIARLSSQNLRLVMSIPKRLARF